MTKGIYGKAYIDIEQYIDMNAFENLHAQICRGFILGQPNVSLGYLDLYEPNKPFVNLGIYTNGIRPVWYFYDQYKLLPDDHPIKISAAGLEGNDLIRYITYVYGAHNPYRIHEVLNKENNFESEYFPFVLDWIKNLPIFSHVKSAYFLIVEAGGSSIEHSDPEFEGDKSLHEFIYVRQNTKRPFYVRHFETNEKVYMNSRASCFNDQDYHGSDPCQETTYMLRVDGIFTDSFREILKNVV